MCNGDMHYAVHFERLEVCIDCHDALSGKGRGATRRRWALEDRAFVSRLTGQRRRRAGFR